MNKLFIGLLIIAAGAGVYFFVLKKKKSTTTNSINKELIIGKWKADPGNDSIQYSYDFLENGNIVRSGTDSAAVTDTSHYEWNKKNELVWKETAADSVGRIFAVVKLTQDSLQVRSQDSVLTLFTKIK